MTTKYLGYTGIAANADLDAIVAAAAAGSAAYAVAAAAQAAAAAALIAANAAGNATTPEAHGALGNGIHDDAPAFRAAALALAAVGGGTVVTSGKTYLIATADTTPLSTDEYVAFYLPSNVSLGGGGTLKISNALQNVIPSPSTSRVSVIGLASGTRRQRISDLTFDYSLVTPSRAFCSFHAVLTAAWGATVERLTITGCPGRQAIMAESKARHGGGSTAGSAWNTFRDITIRNCGKNASTVQDDCCMLYLEGDHHLVDDCDFINDVAALANCDGLDFHGSYMTVRKSRFTNLWPAMYIGVAGASGTVCVQPVVDDCEFTTCNGGIAVTDYTKGMQIKDSFFDNCGGTNFYRTIGCSRNDVTGADAGPQIGAKISGNTFINDAAGVATISLAGLQASSIAENTFIGLTNPILLLAGLTPTKTIRIANNQFADPIDSAFNAGQVGISGDVGGAWAGTFADIDVMDNQFIKTRGTAVATNVFAFQTTTSGASTATGLRFFRNTVVNFAGTINAFGGAFSGAISSDIAAGLVSYSPTWTQPSGTQPSLGNGTLTGSYVNDGTQCTVRLRLTMGSTTTFGNSGVGYQFSLPFAVNAGLDIHQPGAANVLDLSALLDFSAQASVGATLQVVSLAYKGGLVANTVPIVWAAGDIIDIGFSYPV